LIVIDAPSLNEHPEVALLSAHADLAIVVVRDGADIAAINNAKAKLLASGSPAIGAIVNQVGAQPLRRLEAAS
jgi:Mrp family chromosome partitioning ATPase